MSNYKLTELFPHIDDEIIGYVYAQAGGDLEKSINLLLQMVKDSRTNINKDEARTVTRILIQLYVSIRTKIK